MLERNRKTLRFCPWVLTLKPYYLELIWLVTNLTLIFLKTSIWTGSRIAIYFVEGSLSNKAWQLYEKSKERKKRKELLDLRHVEKGKPWWFATGRPRQLHLKIAETRKRARLLSNREGRKRVEPRYKWGRERYQENQCNLAVYLSLSRFLFLPLFSLCLFVTR